MGIVEFEWLETLATINTEEVTFIDILEAGRRLAVQLKQEVSFSGDIVMKRFMPTNYIVT